MARAAPGDVAEPPSTVGHGALRGAPAASGSSVRGDRASPYTHGPHWPALSDGEVPRDARGLRRPRSTTPGSASTTPHPSVAPARCLRTPCPRTRSARRVEVASTCRSSRPRGGHRAVRSDRRPLDHARRTAVPSASSQTPGRDRADDGREDRSGLVGGADRSVPLRAVAGDHRQVGQRLDVLHERGRAAHPRSYGTRRDEHRLRVATVEEVARSRSPRRRRSGSGTMSICHAPGAASRALARAARRRATRGLRDHRGRRRSGSPTTPTAAPRPTAPSITRCGACCSSDAVLAARGLALGAVGDDDGVTSVGDGAAACARWGSRRLRDRAGRCVRPWRRTRHARRASTQFGEWAVAGDVLARRSPARREQAGDRRGRLGSHSPTTVVTRPARCWLGPTCTSAVITRRCSSS